LKGEVEMLLVIDAGNTNIVFGFYRGDELVNHYRMTTDKEHTIDEFGMFMLNAFNIAGIPPVIEGAAISSVVGSVIKPLIEAVKKYFKVEPTVVNTSMDMGIKIKYDNIKELGTDRFVNAVAAFTLYKKAIIIIDFGTATTFGCLNSKGEFLGGAICPGINISLESLPRRTSKLPGVEIIKPQKAIGTNTVANIQSGVFLGHVGQVEYLIRQLKSEMNESDITVIATGGLAPVIASSTGEIHEIREFLTLEGLKMIYNKLLNH
jgi:type III pantothenate kinase